MRKIFSTLLASALALSLGAQDISWSRVEMDGSRTGCSSPTADNVAEALGQVKGKSYHAPNGKIYKKGAVTAVAEAMIAAQPAMADIKTVVATCPDGMQSKFPESPLSNFTADFIMWGAAGIFGEEVDCSLMNFGGIRTSMPAGEVLMDDMLSMFPFKNQIVLAHIRGSKLKELIAGVVSRRVQPVGGMTIRVEDDVMTELKVGGQSVDDERLYKLATITFLLRGGDDIHVADYAEKLEISDVNVIDVALGFIKKETDAGRPLSASRDGRVTYLVKGREISEK